MRQRATLGLVTAITGDIEEYHQLTPIGKLFQRVVDDLVPNGRNITSGIQRQHGIIMGEVVRSVRDQIAIVGYSEPDACVQDTNVGLAPSMDLISAIFLSTCFFPTGNRSPISVGENPSSNSLSTSPRRPLSS